MLYAADKEVFWWKTGLTVDLADVEDPAQRLNAGQLEGMASTVDAFVQAATDGSDPGPPVLT